MTCDIHRYTYNFIVSTGYKNHHTEFQECLPLNPSSILGTAPGGPGSQVFTVETGILVPRDLYWITVRGPFFFSLAPRRSNMPHPLLKPARNTPSPAGEHSKDDHLCTEKLCPSFLKVPMRTESQKRAILEERLIFDRAQPTKTNM